jgi:hypothetical protein
MPSSHTCAHLYHIHITLQALKLKQAIAKEEKLLELHTKKEDGDARPAAAEANADPTGGLGVDENGAAVPHEWGDSGAGLARLPSDHVDGAVVATDGLFMSPSRVVGAEFRLVTGMYDDKGQVCSTRAWH